MNEEGLLDRLNREGAGDREKLFIFLSLLINIKGNLSDPTLTLKWLYGHMCGIKQNIWKWLGHCLADWSCGLFTLIHLFTFGQLKLRLALQMCLFVRFDRQFPHVLL